MNRWQKASYYALNVLCFVLKWTLYICCACFILFLPSIGVAIWIDCTPIAGIPITIICSLVTMCCVVAFVGEKVGDWKDGR